jgi:hypothetical protein
MTNLDEGQKVSYDVVPNPKTRKSSAERLLEKRSEPLAAVNVAPLRARKGVSLSVALMFLGSVAGSNGLTTTRAGSGRRYKLWRFTNRDCDKEAPWGCSRRDRANGAEFQFGQGFHSAYRDRALEPANLRQTEKIR